VTPGSRDIYYNTFGIFHYFGQYLYIRVEWKNRIFEIELASMRESWPTLSVINSPNYFEIEEYLMLPYWPWNQNFAIFRGYSSKFALLLENCRRYCNFDLTQSKENLILYKFHNWSVLMRLIIFEIIAIERRRSRKSQSRCVLQ